MSQSVLVIVPPPPPVAEMVKHLSRLPVTSQESPPGWDSDENTKLGKSQIYVAMKEQLLHGLVLDNGEAGIYLNSFFVLQYI